MQRRRPLSHRKLAITNCHASGKSTHLAKMENSGRPLSTWQRGTTRSDIRGKPRPAGHEAVANRLRAKCLCSTNRTLEKEGVLVQFADIPFSHEHAGTRRAVTRVRLDTDWLSEDVLIPT